MKSLINRITKLWEEIKEAGIFSSIWMALFIGILIFLIFSSIGAEKGLSRDEICQKHFGKDYVYQIPKTIHETPYCLGNDGVRKYLKRDEYGNINQ